MAENKKIVVTKEEAEALLKKSEENKKSVKTAAKIEPKEEVVETPVKETVEEHIFKGAKKDSDTFAERAAEAAATAALKSAISANSEIAIKEAEKTYFIEKKNHMLNRCKTDEVVDLTVDKINAQYLGKVYTFAYNGIPVTVYCDGKPHKYPKFIADKIRKKLTAISESNTYKEEVDDLLS